MSKSKIKKTIVTPVKKNTSKKVVAKVVIPILEIGHKIKLSEDKINYLNEFDKKINELEINLGRVRAAYIATEQSYISKRTTLENAKIDALNSMAIESGINLNSNEKWNFDTNLSEFERKL